MKTKNASLIVGLLAVASSCTECSMAKQEPKATPKPSAVEIGLSVNNATTATLFAGWPLVLRLNGAWMRDDGDAVALLASDLELNVVSAAGAPKQWPLQREKIPDTRTWGPNDGVLQVLWTVDAESASALTVGRYSVKAKWAGIESDPLDLQFVEPPSALSLEERLAFAELGSQVAMARGDPAQAAEISANALQDSPNDPRMLARRALAYEAQGEYRLAREAIRKAISAAGPHPEGNEPSYLFHLAARIEGRIQRDGGR